MAKSKSSGATARRPIHFSGQVKTANNDGLTDTQRANRQRLGGFGNGVLEDIKETTVGTPDGNDVRIGSTYWYAPRGQDYMELSGSFVDAIIERNPYGIREKWSLLLKSAGRSTSFESNSVDELIKKAQKEVR